MRRGFPSAHPRGPVGAARGLRALLVHVALVAGCSAGTSAKAPAPAAPPAALGSAEVEAPELQVWGHDLATALDTDDVELARSAATIVARSAVAVSTELSVTVLSRAPSAREARVRLVLPAGAEVSGLALSVGGRWMPGALIDRRRGQGIYDEITAPAPTPRDPAILVRERGRRVLLRVSPVSPGESREVRLRWEVPPPLEEVPEGLAAEARATEGEPDADDPSMVLRLVGRAAAAPPPPPRDRVYVLDASRSLGGRGLGAQRALLGAALARHRPGERFAVLGCASSCAAYPAEGLAAPGESARGEALRFVAELRPRGASDLAAAIEAGARRAPSGGQVVWMTDLAPTVGPLSALDLARHAERALRDGLEGGSKELRILLLGAEAEGAPARALERTAGAHVHLVDDRPGTRPPGGAQEAPAPLAADAIRRAVDPLFDRPLVRIERAVGEGVASWDVAPRVLCAGAPFVAFGRSDATIAGGSFHLRLVPDGGPARPPAWEGAPAPALLPDAGGALVRAWARARVDALDAKGDERSAESARRLAARHGLLDGGTALLAVEDDAMARRYGLPQAGSSALRRSMETGGPGGPRDDRPPPPPRPAPTWPAGSEVSGRIPPEIIQRPIRAARGALAACVAAAEDRDPDFRGRVVVSFEVIPGGEVRGARAEGDVWDREVLRCVEDVFAGLRFPDPGARAIRVLYPMHLGRGPERDEAAPPGAPRPTSWRLEARLGPRAPTAPPPAPPALDAGATPRRALRLGLERVRALLAAGHLAQALAAARALAATFDEEPEALAALADAAAALGDGHTAARALEDRLELSPGDADARAAAATARDALGETGRACRIWRGFLGSAPSVRIEQRARQCLEAAPLPAPAPPALGPGRVGARAVCERPERGCAQVVVIDARGRVASPWTPGSAGHPGLPALPGGAYRLHVVGAEGVGRVTLEVRGAGDARSVELDPTRSSVSLRIVEAPAR